MEVGSQRILWAICVIAMATLLLAVAGFKGPFSSEMASWIQAVGSIAALLGVWWSTTATFGRQQSERRHLHAQQAKIILHVAKQLSAAIGQAEESLDNPTAPRFREESFDGVSHALNEIRLAEAPTETVAIALLNLRQICGSYREGYVAAQTTLSQGRSAQAIRSSLAEHQASVATAVAAITVETNNLSAKIRKN